ncbi:MAG: right-handed parallel beta-helix repeat-containing protein [Clostridia bacterium]|nr:right-handed parallel beta-helix repeat-containing protein [Clostridia bacterium]
MKKFLCALLALGMTLSMAFTAACGGGENGSDVSSNSSLVDSSEISSEVSSKISSEISSESSSEISSEEDEEDEDIFIPDYTSTEQVEEYFANKVGTVTYKTGKDLFIESLSTNVPIYLGSYCEDNVFTIDGGEDFDRSLTILGQGGGVVQANGGVLVLKNLTIYNDTHGFEQDYYRPYYAEFGGKVRFENCTIADPIQLRNDAEAEFINCEITSRKTDAYGVWVADGSARFDGCKFTGYRGLKVHEIGGMDVVNVSVENCFFENLSKKPTIAIDIAEELSTTTIAFVNCDIYACAEWSKDSFEGVDGFYESDQDTTTFTFTATDCYLDGMLFSFEDGEIIWLDE